MNKCDNFSFLDNDDKTFLHITEYFNALQNGIKLISIDNILQKREIEIHLNKCKKEQTQEETLKWIEKNAVPFRNYINSLKILSLYLYIHSKMHYNYKLIKEDFGKIVNMWNNERCIVLEVLEIIETIRIEKEK